MWPLCLAAISRNPSRVMLVFFKARSLRFAHSPPHSGIVPRCKRSRQSSQLRTRMCRLGRRCSRTLHRGAAYWQRWWRSRKGTSPRRRGCTLFRCSELTCGTSPMHTPCTGRHSCSRSQNWKRSQSRTRNKCPGRCRSCTYRLGRPSSRKVDRGRFGRLNLGDKFQLGKMCTRLSRCSPDCICRLGKPHKHPTPRAHRQGSSCRTKRHRRLRS